MDKKKMNLTFESENLAVPEIHTNETENETDKTDEETSVIYDNVAIPENTQIPPSLLYSDLYSKYSYSQGLFNIYFSYWGE